MRTVCAPYALPRTGSCVFGSQATIRSFSPISAAIKKGACTISKTRAPLQSHTLSALPILATSRTPLFMAQAHKRIANQTQPNHHPLHSPVQYHLPTTGSPVTIPPPGFN
jgi:hypothetical protein